MAAGGGAVNAAANDDAAGVLADVEHRLLAIVAPDLPAHERRVEGRGLLVIGALIVEVIEPHRLPARRLERRHERCRVARRVAAPGAGRLRERGRRRDRSDSESLQQLAAGDGRAVGVVGEECERIGHEALACGVDAIHQGAPVQELSAQGVHRSGLPAGPLSRYFS